MTQVVRHRVLSLSRIKHLIYLSVITDVLVQQIGISEKQYETWVELQMVEFSVLLHCRK
jgi:hypothetical protein